MPILLWLVGIPIPLIILILLTGQAPSLGARRGSHSSDYYFDVKTAIG
jgi:hypothetical protein